MVQFAVRVEELGRPSGCSPCGSGCWLQWWEGQKKEVGEEEGWRVGVLLSPKEQTMLGIKISILHHLNNFLFHFRILLTFLLHSYWYIP